jgi:hypothetical protein
MGNLQSYIDSAVINSMVTNNNNNETKSTETENVDLDKYSKSQIIEHIKKIKPKSLDVDKDFSDKVKDVTLNNQNMMAMYIELYDKLQKVLSEKKFDQTKVKKIFYVKPDFDSKKVMDNITSEHNAEQKVYVLEADASIKKPEVAFNTEPISIEEFNQAFNECTYNKDMIGISKKILVALPNYFKLRFINCMNKLYKGELEASDVAIGKGTYLYKFSKKGPKDDISSFRKIISIPNIVTHYHRILGQRLYNFMEKNNYIDMEIQKGAVKQKGPLLQQICKMKEILKHANTNKQKLAVMFLDISDAFNNLNRDTMFQILEQYSVDKSFINYLRSFYNSFEYYMQTKDWSTETVKWKTGVVQGCSMSPLLFIVCLNYILKKLNTHKDDYGYTLDNAVKVMLLAYMDDICIICKDKDSLNKAYERLEKSLETLGLSVNKQKTAIMLVGEDETGLENTSLKGIPLVKTFKYLGEYISSDGTNTEAYNAFFRDLGRKLFAINKKKMTNKEKFDLFDKTILPSVHRKLTMMYDLNNTQKYNILVLVNRYTNTWRETDTVADTIQLFSDSKSILNSIKDSVLNSFDLQIDVQEDMDLSNFVFKNNKVEFKYGDKDSDQMIDEIIRS